MTNRVAGILCAMCVAASMMSFAIAQEAKEAKPSTKAKGRLPAYYKDVVTPDQKDKIYRIQAKYGEQIRKLAEEMKALTEQRDKEVEAVLTAEQKAKVDALKADNKKKPAAAAEESTTETSADAATKSPAKSTAAK